MILGLTGGIGSGKSTVAKLFNMLGWAHFSSDQAAKELYFESPFRNQIIELLGEEAYFNSNTLNKTYISEKVFKDPMLLQSLNAILHPAVKEKFKTFIQAQNSPLILKESALLFETGLEKQVDQIVMVSAPDDLRIERVARRDQLSKEQIIDRMKAQWPQDEKIKRSHFVVQNDEIHSLIEQVMHIHNSLLSF